MQKGKKKLEKLQAEIKVKDEKASEIPSEVRAQVKRGIQKLKPIQDKVLQNIEQSNTSVYITDDVKLLEEIKKILNNESKYLNIYAGLVNDETAQKIKKDTGVDISNYRVGFNESYLIHWRNDHLLPNSKGSKMSYEDILLGLDIINNYEKVEKGFDNSGNQILIFTAKGSTHYIIETEIYSNKKKRIIFETIYKSQKIGVKKAASQPNVSSSEGSPLFTSETKLRDDAASTSNITENEEEVNKGNKQFSKQLDSNGNKLTKQQVEYFKGSKVRDENGNLLIVYHGTQSDFNVYDKNKLGKMTNSNDAKLGFHLTDNKDLATIFSNLYSDELIYKITDEVTNEFGYDDVDEIEKRLKTFAEKNGKVKAQYINLIKPLDLTIGNNNTSIDDIGYAVSYALLGTKEVNDNQEEITNSILSNFNNEIAMFKDELVNTKGALDRLKELGYDGLILPLSKTDAQTLVNEYEFGNKNLKIDGKEYIVFESNQIKNVTNQSPTTNPDIRYSVKDTETKVNRKGQGVLNPLNYTKNREAYKK